MSRPRILALLPDVPWPLDSGKRIRQWTNLRALAQIGAVDAVACFSESARVGPPPDMALTSYADVRPGLRSPLRAAPELLRARPWAIARRRWDAVRSHLSRLDGEHDLVWFGGLDHALELRSSVRAGRTIIDMDDIETEKLRAFLSTQGDGSVAERLTRAQRRVELPMWQRAQRLSGGWADRVLVCSEQDRRLLGVPNAEVVPNAFPEPAPVVEGPRSRALVLVGNYSYEPNRDSAVFMVEEVLPRIRSAVPDAELRLVGRGGGAVVSSLAAHAGVEHVGEVASTAPEIAGAGAAVVPVRWGGGTRIKILEAFAYGTPVVSTPLGCAGYPVWDGEHLLIRDDAQGFADACVSVLRDPAQAQQMAERGRALYLSRYTPDAVGAEVTRIVEEILG